MIHYFVPSSLKEALKILNENDCYIFAGGTDLMVQKHLSSGLLPNFDKDVLFIMKINELNYIEKDNEDNIHIGATTRYNEIEASSLIPEIYKTVIKEIASPNIRNMATLAGNIGNASPAGDSLLPLILNDAEVVLSSISGERIIKVQDFILGVKKLDRKQNEIIKEIVIKPQELNYFYRKVGSRKAESITKVSFLGGYKIEKNRLVDFRVAFGSVSTKVVRNQEVENKYINKELKDIDIESVFNDYTNLVTPITDQRSNKEYRHKVAMNLLKKFLKEIKGGRDE